jgi:hypothetical protein
MKEARQKKPTHCVVAVSYMRFKKRQYQRDRNQINVFQELGMVRRPSPKRHDRTLGSDRNILFMERVMVYPLSKFH